MGIEDLLKNIKIPSFDLEELKRPMVNDDIMAVLQSPPKNVTPVSLEEQLAPLIKNSEETIEQLKENNNELRNNYEQLSKLYEAKQKEALESTKELKKAKIMNIVMFALTLISTVVAVCSWLFPTR